MKSNSMYIFLLVSTELAFCLGISKESFQGNEQPLLTANSDVTKTHDGLVKRSSAYKRLPGWTVYYGKRSADFPNDSNDSTEDEAERLKDISSETISGPEHVPDENIDDILDYEKWVHQQENELSGNGNSYFNLENEGVDTDSSSDVLDDAATGEEKRSGWDVMYGKRSPAWFTAGYGKRSPAWFSAGYGKRSPAWFSAGYGKRSPAWFTAGYGKRSPAWFSSYGKKSPAWFSNYGKRAAWFTGYGKRNAWFTGYGKRNAWFTGYGKRSPAWFSSYGKRNPAWFTGYGKRSPGWMVSYGRRSPAWFSSYGKRDGWIAGYGKREHSKDESNDTEMGALNDIEAERIIAGIKDISNREKQANTWSSGDQNTLSQAWSGVYER